MSLLRPLRTLIVDDEAIARRSIAALLTDDPELQLIGECANGTQALESIRTLGPDLVLLDIQMPGLSGLEVARRLAKEDPPWIVFVTAFDRYAVEAFEAQAIDYLLKPVDPDRLKVAVGRAKEAFHSEVAQKMARRVLEFLSEGKGPPLEPPTELRRPVPEPHQLSIPDGAGIIRLSIADVRWIESDDQYSILHCGEARHRIRRSMGDLERELAPKGFFRLHRSFLVPLQDIQRLEVRQPGGTGEAVLSGGKRLPVSRARLPSLRSLLRQ